MQIDTILDYKKFSNELKFFATNDLQLDFEKLCEFAIIYKPNYLTNALSDEEVQPYIPSKYINLICRYIEKKITLRILFDYFGLNHIIFTDQEYKDEFDPSNYMICSMENKSDNPYDIIYPITWEDEDFYAKESTNHEYKLKAIASRYKILSYKEVLDIEVKIDSFVSSDLVKDEINDTNFDFVKQITYRLHKIIMEFNKNYPIVLNDSLIFKDILYDNKTIQEDKNIRPTIIMIDEPKSNAKIEKNIQLADRSLQIIYNYNLEELKLEKKSNVLKNLTNLLNSILDKLE